MARRGPVIAVHWPTGFARTAMIGGGSSLPGPRRAFGGAGAVWLMLAGGPPCRPGPGRIGLAGTGLVPFRLALCGVLAMVGALNALALTGRAFDLAAWNALPVLLALASFHAIFHLWQHSAPGAGGPADDVGPPPAPPHPGPSPR